MSDRDRTRRQRARHGWIRASLVSATCFLRGLPLFFRAAPRTPLRVLGIIALDTLHVLRHSQPLSRQKVNELALFLDFQGCANADWDHKNLCDEDYLEVRQRLEKAGLGSCVEEYLGRLREVESRRPAIGGDHRRFDDVRGYREAIARLSIATAAAIALDDGNLEEAIQATRCDIDLETLFLILMQCQIIDDVLDYQEDLSAGLPSFLTATASLPQALALTAQGVRFYAARREHSSDTAVLPLRMALWVFSAMTTLAVRLGGRSLEADRLRLRAVKGVR